MKTLNIIYVLALVAVCNYGQGFAQKPTVSPSINFISAQNLPYPLAYANGVTDGHYMYAVAGYKGFGASSSQVLRYDPGTNRWALFANIIGNQIQTGAAYVPAIGKIYVIGGVSGEFTDATLAQNIQSIDVNTGAVEKLKITNPMPGAHTSAVEWDNKIYVFGGTRDNRNTINSLYCFDPQTLQFTRLANMPEYLQTAGTVVNGVIYTFGGYDAFTKRQSGNIYAYNIKANKWTKAGKLPTFISESSVVAKGDKIFVVGSHDDEDFIGYYDTRNNQFTKLKSNMQARKEAALGVLYDHLVVFGGTTRFKEHRLTTLQTTQIADLR